ncbi:DUF1176 domain-containing protein [Aquabacterium fontiphilum]|nr:DUF1176 domain-containing protein [Aquabacterium fontiphilum]
MGRHLSAGVRSSAWRRGAIRSASIACRQPQPCVLFSSYVRQHSCRRVRHPLRQRALPPHAAGVSFGHLDWELACDNTRTCRAAGYQPEEAGLAVSLLLTRAAGPGTPVQARLTLGDYGRLGTPTALARPGTQPESHLAALALPGGQGRQGAARGCAQRQAPGRRARRAEKEGGCGRGVPNRQRRGATELPAPGGRPLAGQQAPLARGLQRGFVREGGQRAQAGPV